MNSNVECLTQRSIDPSDNPVGSPIRDMISNEIATQETNRFNQRPAEIFERTTDIFSIRRHVSKVPGAVIQRHVALNVRRSKTPSVKRCEKRSSEAPAGEVQS